MSRLPRGSCSAPKRCATTSPISSASCRWPTERTPSSAPARREWDKNCRHAAMLLRASQIDLQARLHLRPLVVEDAIHDRVALIAILHDHVLAQDALAHSA